MFVFYSILSNKLGILTKQETSFFKVKQKDRYTYQKQTETSKKQQLIAGPY